MTQAMIQLQQRFFKNFSEPKGQRTVAFWQREVPLAITLAHGRETLQLFPSLTVKRTTVNVV